MKLLAAGAAGSALAGCTRPPDLGPMVFPGDDWLESPPEELGFNLKKLEKAARFLADNADEAGWHVTVIRNGHLVFDRGGGIDPHIPRGMASLGKSVFVSMLGIAIADGKIKSAADKLTDYYPEIRGAAGEFGPYPSGGRFFSDDDEGVTLRHLATHTGGFMRPDEPPGSKFTYDTFGMACLMHAISKQYGFYDSDKPDPSRGDGTLIEEKMRDPIGAGWTWQYTNFPNHPPQAKLNLFSNYITLHMTPRRDMARLGLLWLANGKWGDNQIIPENWHRQSIRVAREVRTGAPEDEWAYGQGFWVNEYGKLWPDLPRDSYMAAGFPNHKLWMCPSLSLVVAISPGLPRQKRFEKTVTDARFLEKVAGAVRG